MGDDAIVLERAYVRAQMHTEGNFFNYLMHNTH